MYKTFLVETDIEDGRRILEELEKRHLRITAAFWLRFEEEDNWKLVVVSPDVVEKGTTSLYTMIAGMLNDLSINAHKPVQFPLDRITLASPHSLRYKTVRDNSGIRFGPVREGPAMDSYIYRMN